MTIYDDLVRRRAATPLYDELRRTRTDRATTATPTGPTLATTTTVATTALSRRELRARRAAVDLAPPAGSGTARRGRRERRPDAVLSS